MKRIYFVPLFLNAWLGWGCALNNQNYSNRSVSSLDQHQVNCFDIGQILEFSTEITPMDLLKRWEQEANTARFQKPTDPVRVNFVVKPREQFEVSIIDGLSSETSLALERLVFEHSGTERVGVRWFQHPGNTSDAVPFFTEVPEGSIYAYYSASRSMFDDSQFSLKMPTSFPHPNAPEQDTKALMAKDAIIALERSRYLSGVDQVQGDPPELIILKEVASVIELSSGNGYTVRDLMVLQDGKYYLPAFSIPYVGLKISDNWDLNFSEFWSDSYAQKIGKIKAMLFLRYGLQLKSPNAQNFLIQLDEDLLPTGVIVLRDLGDSQFVDFLLEDFPFRSLLPREDEAYYDQQIATSLSPRAEDSFWQMEEAGISRSVFTHWENDHDQAYIQFFVDELALEQNFLSISELEEFLKTSKGRDALKDYWHKVLE